MTTLVDRLIARVAIADSGCWEWQGALTEHGYGRMSWQGVVRRTHRLAAHWWLGVDLTDESVKVRHSCDNPRCCNPDHLLVGTQADNVADMMERHRWAGGAKPWSECKLGHPLVGENAMPTKSNGRRRCRECSRAANREYRKRRTAREGAYWRKVIRAIGGEQS